MSRPTIVWAIFGVCLAISLTGMAWLTHAAQRAEKAEQDATRHALVEENIRLALWRMDSALGPLITQESAWPYYAYQSFYPAERAYSRMLTELKKGDVLEPSPLLGFRSPYIRIHYQIDSVGQFSSPQAPVGNMRDLAETSYTTKAAIEQSVEQLERLTGELSVGDLRASLTDSSLDHLHVSGSAPAPQQWNNVKLEAAESQSDVIAPLLRSNFVQQGIKSAAELNKRSMTSNQAAMPVMNFLCAPTTTVRQSVVRPIWIGDSLHLARRVEVNGKELIQGCLLDWPAISAWLLGEVGDLLPGGQLRPITKTENVASSSISMSGSTEEPSDPRHFRMLAALPIQLLPGEVAVELPPGQSSIRVALWIAWGCVAFGATAIGFLLLGTVSLSERRNAFVSAVTHELRTPLTTFRMYIEMLENGMVADEDRRRDYMATLHQQSHRLGQLVENVLAYARIERGSAATKRSLTTVGSLLDQMQPRLHERARQAEMQLQVEACADVLTRQLETDPQAVEQIVFNLVDNSCKYAGRAEDKRIHLTVDENNGWVRIRVSDHGPGVARSERRRLFRPFHKSAREAANSAPGVGLGLALCYRLARLLRGRLSIEFPSSGASLLLEIPSG